MNEKKSANTRFLEFDADHLDQYIRDQLHGVKGPLHLERVGGGQSNPTFFVSYNNYRLVLRKKPPGKLLPSAHAVDREYRIMGALAKSDVPVPEMILYEEDSSVIGTPFFLMQRLNGRVFPDYGLPGVSPEHRKAMYFSMLDTMVSLHQVDWRRCGLDGFGKPKGYFARQIHYWTKQWGKESSRVNPWLDQLIEWLPKNIPNDDEGTICHGDFRVGNLMFHPTEPKVIAVLDWELSTIGHPLADLAYNTMAYHISPSEYGGIKGLDLASLGIPSKQEYLARYNERTHRGSGDSSSVSEFHYAFSLFRFAVLFEGIATRAEAGNASSSNAAQVAALAPKLAKRAMDIVENGLSS